MEVISPEAHNVAVAHERAGFRLHRVEVYNWGTFHGKVWSLSPQGDNALLTGDIGSGKSTLVDAITSLLVPANKIIYNKAAGADSKERTLKSYVLGYYKSERADNSLAARPVALRDQNSYSVILGHFRNEGFEQHVTLAQVFWIRDGEGQPERFYVTADVWLTIAEHFAGFGTDIGDLKKRLRRTACVEIHDSFAAYGAAFRRRFGIGNEQALDLFNQTVSMKSIGNLTEFVRNHMLEPFPVEGRIEALVSHFNDLNRAHESVLKAKRQVAALEPLVADGERYTELLAQMESLRDCRDALKPWFAKLKSELLQKRLENLDADIERLTGRIAVLSERRRDQHAQRDDVKQAMAENGGDRIERIKTDILRLQEEKVRRLERAEKYNALAAALGLPAALDAESFMANVRQLQFEHEAMQDQQLQAQNAHTEAEVEFRQWRREHDDIAQEIASLRERRSNLPSDAIAIRQSLCDALSVAADDLPFAGELLQVRSEEKDWEGAAERLLRGFGLSLLVPDQHYADVAAWVDRTHLRGRLVYFRVRDRDGVSLPALPPQSLVRKLAVKPDSPFYRWLDAEVARRFDYACCDNLEQFRRETQAITRAGQIKGRAERHEKDDRHRLDDRTRYILGWSNAAKIAALEKKAAGFAVRVQTIADRIGALQKTRSECEKRLRQASQMEVYTDFRELDWRLPTLDIEQLEREKQQLERASDVLRTLQQQLDALDKVCADVDSELKEAEREQAVAQSKRQEAIRLFDEACAIWQVLPAEVAARHFPLLDAMRLEAIGDQRLTVESCDNRQTDMREWLQAKLDAEQKKIDRLRDKIIDAMRSYKNSHQIETQEVDVSVDAMGTYRQMLLQLNTDDLPRFEVRFKQLLNENTIREVANFQAQLNRERQEIRERIETINNSLRAIDYNPGRYIVLLAEPSPDADVRDFQQQLRACTEGALTGSDDEQYTEAKFLEVKAIVERFRGRDGTAELDRRWTRKVTDVRNGFVFSASERWRDDDAEHEHYSDAGGKSGGQKEKLAYTVLAASLAYQFGLEWGEQRSRSFRFVVIDEAFGRGSDESARYGLELFKRLNLQLLIVTPLQKIHIIEPFVASVGFVHNADGRQSLLRHLTIEEYRAEKAARTVAVR
ncbi:MAG: ATP-dependent exonuclease SbcCD, C subunit-like protein [Gammaproteobacteria bacterium]|nr:ATP-dependent exonuclease SbcCD, C subunit-like protein [Gammaproteobacteria bacterium]